ncbi:MAG: hypothetical protein L0Z62_44240 [Gemmataceae bacterium]|nr:hypothetical protein [Gemmataceae bacterium]
MSDIEPFEEFLARTASARPEDYPREDSAEAEASGPEPAVSAAEFERMKRYILDYYEGVRPVHSFLSPSGQVIDCVPFEQQPSVRAARAAGYSVTQHHRPPTPPPHTQRQGTPTPAPPEAARTSPCPQGSVPMVRLTLERLVGLGNLDNLFRQPGGEHPPFPPPS